MDFVKSNDQKPASMRVFLETFGCQMNILDSELVENQFKEAGHIFVDKPENANVVLLNTCSVRDLSEQKVLSRLGIIKDRKDKGEKVVVGVLGCMAERANDGLAKSRPFIDVMVGPSKIQDTKNLVEEAFAKNSHETLKSLSYFINRKASIKDASLSPMDSLEALDRSRATVQKSSSQAYVRITRGCNKFCSFCVVPRTRGPEMHRHPQSIIDEVKNLVENGTKEVTLLGQTINHYFYQEAKRWSFADLLFQIHEQVPDLPRLRFLTSYPRDFTDEALDVMRDCSRICRYLHIPAQSGSDKVLRDMNRGYDLETYLSLIERAKAKMPDINILGDMIVGFPTENEEDFQLSLDLLENVRFKNLFIFKYSPRPNTIAQKRFQDLVSMDEKKRRHQIMLDKQNEIGLLHHQAMVGKCYKILCESEAKNNGLLVQLRKDAVKQKRLLGRTEGDHIVHFFGSEDLLGRIVEVKIDEARPLWLGASLAS